MQASACQGFAAASIVPLDSNVLDKYRLAGVQLVMSLPKILNDVCQHWGSKEAIMGIGSSLHSELWGLML